MEPDYEKLARDAEAVLSQAAEEGDEMAISQPTLAPNEVQTRGPVLIDTVTGVIKHAETGETLLEPVPPEDPPKERELPIDHIAVGLVLFGALLLLTAIILSSFTASQKSALAALVFIVLGERIWFEIRRMKRDLQQEGEGVAYAAEIGQSDFGAADTNAAIRSIRGGARDSGS